MLLLDDAAFEKRRAVAHGALAPLAQSLAADLEPVLDREVFIPAEKALLSREGGRCVREDALLEFDPFDHETHRCPICGAEYTGELHYRFWIYWYQLWLIERAVHASLLAALGVDERFASFAADVLERYAEQYLSYPNVDNVLGPSRLFFSTYLESIWLLNVCMAVDFLERRNPSIAGRARDRIIEPARALVAQYDEGRSNRQVWNDTALLAAAQLLGDDRAADDAVYGLSGVATHLSENLLADGTWYEGENYHLFAHRGLWCGVTMAERAQMELPAPLVERFQLGFATPFATALPDFTLPSRRDSPYAISLRQWRIAEHCELGVARRPDAPLLAALAKLYESSNTTTPHETGRARSSADVERNAAPSALSRADLSWRALLFAAPELPPLEGAAPESALLDAQGIGVFRRRRGEVYVALDYGNSGGGHGHPDRLNLLLADDTTRWLDDFGTGSYVDPSLHWYRSTLAHNAPLVDGQSQQRVDGELEAYEETEQGGWIAAVADELAPGAGARRTLIVMPTYCIDIVQWEAERDVTVDLPLHVDLEIVSPAVEALAAPLSGGSGEEDGFNFVRDPLVETVPANVSVTARATQNAASLDAFVSVAAASEWWGAIAPGPPGDGDHRFRIVRARAAEGDIRIVWSWAGDVVGATFDEGIRISLADGTTHSHRASETGWRIEAANAGRIRVIELGGLIPPASDFPDDATVDDTQTEPIALDASGAPLTFELAETHYRRSEQSWSEAGEPRATVMLGWKPRTLRLTVDVPTSDRTFVPAGATNPYDNERPEINGDGVQLYVRDAGRLRAWLLVPVTESADVRVLTIDAWEGAPAPTARWRPTATGYHVDATIPFDQPPLAIDVIVNEMPRGRERRRGQLVLSGAAGEFVYLRGDRNDPLRLIPLRLSNA